MAWYTAGTVALTAGSNVVTGAGTAWMGLVLAGEGVDAPDGRIYEIAEVVNNTRLILVGKYLGATAGAAVYQIIPNASMTKELTGRVNALIGSFDGVPGAVQQHTQQIGALQTGKADAQAMTTALSVKADATVVNEAIAAASFEDRKRENHTGVQDAATVTIGGVPLWPAIAPALALANTFTVVPATNQGPMVVVTQPHLRFMVWDGAKYVRAPWHRPGRIFYTHHNNASEPGALPVRADVSYAKANYPDLCEALGITGTGNFTLLELRGEFLRVLDNGRGVDVGRGSGSAQGFATQAHTHFRNTNQSAEAGFTNRASGNEAGQTEGGRTYDTLGSSTGLMAAGVSAAETRPRNVALPAWVTF